MTPATRIKEILAEIRKVEQAATKGWELTAINVPGMESWLNIYDEKDGNVCVPADGPGPIGNGKFIVHSRTWLPSLVDALETLTAQRNAYRDLYWRAANSGIIEQKVLRESDDAEIVSKLEGKP